MNKKLVILLAIVWIIASALTICVMGEADAPVNGNFKGVWECGRAGIDMIRKDSGYIALIHWGSSYAEHTSWQYTLQYDEASDILIDEGTGIKSVTVFGDNGEEVSYTEEYTDGSARFFLNEDGKLIWEDAKEDAGKDMEFTKIIYTEIFPTKEELVEDYFHVIGGFHEGTAGSSLAKAQAAYKAYDFAQRHQLWNADIPTLRETILSAWESMSDEERHAFDANFISVVRLIKDCTADWDSYKGVFSDAGVPDRMAFLLKDIPSAVSWDTLVAHTLTMGNSSN